MQNGKGKFVQPVELNQVQFFKRLLIGVLAYFFRKQFNVLDIVQILIPVSELFQDYHEDTISGSKSQADYKMGP